MVDRITSSSDEAILSQQRGIDGLSTILRLDEPISDDFPFWVTDLDDTAKEAIRHLWTDGKARKVLPETVAAFLALHSRSIPVGVVTEQAFSEIEPFLTDVAKLALGEQAGPYDLFNGPMIGEGGNVARKRTGEITILTPKQALADRKKFLAWLHSNVKESSGKDGWGVLDGVNPETATLVQLPGDGDQGKATLSLWEKGPHIGQDPSYIARYGAVTNRLNNALHELGITTLVASEAGNGTARIRPNRMDKARALGLLVAFKALNPKAMVYSCDGPNDVSFARKLKLHGGGVVAVENAVTDLKAIADYNANGVAGLGFADTVSRLLPDQYQAAMANLASRNLALSSK